MNNSPLVLKAIAFAFKKHGEQSRKKTGLPYVVHLHGVALLIQVFKKSKHLEELICAAYLHDILEDTDTTVEELRREFGDFITSLVVELTNDKEMIERDFGGSKVAYLEYKLTNCSSYALTLKLCDRLDNILSQPTSKVQAETRRLLDYIVMYRKLSRTQEALVDRIRVLLPQ